ncbi:MAG: hypothetical protein GYA24_12540 [Candidatus Lokiarchaeota archaeon]|nr:hypothetical protein [Candidatus Lokiarchaeota archaeon]
MARRESSGGPLPRGERRAATKLPRMAFIYLASMLYVLQASRGSIHASGEVQPSAVMDVSQ